MYPMGRIKLEEPQEENLVERQNIYSLCEVLIWDSCGGTELS